MCYFKYFESYIYTCSIKYQMKLGNYPLNLEDPFNQARNFEQYQNISIRDLGINLTEVVVWVLQIHFTTLM